MPMEVRTASPRDAGPMARLINEIIAIGGTTAHRRPFDKHRIRAVFIAATRGICCFVAVEKAQILGFQALEWCDPDWPGEDRLPADWAVIATYVAPAAHGGGIGRALFRETAASAKVWACASSMPPSARRTKAARLFMGVSASSITAAEPKAFQSGSRLDAGRLGQGQGVGRVARLSFRMSAGIRPLLSPANCMSKSRHCPLVLA